MPTLLSVAIVAPFLGNVATAMLECMFERSRIQHRNREASDVNSREFKIAQITCNSPDSADLERRFFHLFDLLDLGQDVIAIE